MYTVAAANRTANADTRVWPTATKLNTTSADQLLLLLMMMPMIAQNAATAKQTQSSASVALGPLSGRLVVRCTVRHVLLRDAANQGVVCGERVGDYGYVRLVSGKCFKEGGCAWGCKSPVHA